MTDVRLETVLIGDPLLDKASTSRVILIVILKTVVTFVLVLVSVLFMVWYERKVISYMQNRVGPRPRPVPSGCSSPSPTA